MIYEAKFGDKKYHSIIFVREWDITAVPYWPILFFLQQQSILSISRTTKVPSLNLETIGNLPDIFLFAMLTTHTIFKLLHKNSLKINTYLKENRWANELTKFH